LTVITTLAAAATVATVPTKNPERNRFIIKHLAFSYRFIMNENGKNIKKNHFWD